MRPIGTPAELERRRRRAVELLRQGESPTVIARILGVARSSLYRWQAMARTEPQGLTARPPHGPEPRLSDHQLEELAALLEQEATEHGWPDARWTAARVTELVGRHFGVQFHPEHVRKMLKQRLGWTSRRSRQRGGNRHAAKRPRTGRPGPGQPSVPHGRGRHSA